jgi:endonuclease YncB( thermonuclease family)
MTKRKAITTVITTLIILVASAIYSANVQQIAPLEAPAPGYYRVVSVADGDTLTVAMNGKEERIRMIGIDTPETHKPNSPVQCYGPEASAFTKNLLANQTVRLEADPIGNNRDRYNRLLRYVYLADNTFVNERLVREGYGFAYLTFPFSKQADFAQLQAEAQDANRGLWQACQTTLNDGRWHTNDL